jgi:heme oxygenase
MEPFTLKLKNETMSNHRALDTHPFVKNMYTETVSKINIQYYIDLHFIILEFMENKIKNEIKDYPDFVDKFNYNKNYKTKDVIQFNSVQKLIDNVSIDNIYAYCYSYYLGILFGGQIIKKLINKTNDELLINKGNMLFNFECDKKELIKNIKDFLEMNIKKDKQQDFINQVNNIYLLTKDVFDEFDNNIVY